MISPCIMKIAVTLLALAPIVFRMPMSRCFSITSRISDATMLSAATMTIRPMVSEIAIFSRPSAENSDLFMSAQSWVTYCAPSRSGIDCAIARRREDVVHPQLDQIHFFLAEQPPGDVEREEAIGLSRTQSARG